MMRPTVRAISMLAVTLVVLMLTGGQAIATKDRGSKITFCHATSAATNPYVVITTDPASIIKKGHGEHTGPLFDPASGQHQQTWGDVIPAFDYPAFGRTPAGHFGGLNVSAGQTLLDRSCASLAAVTRLTLVKKVVNTGGGSASPSAWTLRASGSTTLSGAGGVSGAVAVGSYTLSESGGPGGYVASGWSCKGSVVTAAVVTLGAGDSVTCTITNTFQVPNTPRSAQLTLVKKVVNTGGGSASPSAWTLRASGSTTLSGAGGVSGAVAAGSYTLSESGGPGGYVASGWSCKGTVVTAAVVTLGAGDSVTCTITNTFQTTNTADVPESENPDETGPDEPIEVLGAGASLTPSVPAPAAGATGSTGAPALAFTGADAIVPLGIFGLIALVLGAGLAATARRRARD